jgi:hypothetical protein
MTSAEDNSDDSYSDQDILIEGDDEDIFTLDSFSSVLPSGVRLCQIYVLRHYYFSHFICPSSMISIMREPFVMPLLSQAP